MKAAQLIDAACAAGLTLAAHGDVLHVHPARRLTQELRASLTKHKPEILALLRGRSAANDAYVQTSGMDQEDRARCHAPAWEAREIEVFVERRDRLLQHGFQDRFADGLAERLTLRDREGDDRRMCAAECLHFQRTFCNAHRQAGLQSHEIGRAFATTLQRCPAFSSTYLITKENK